MPYDTIECMSNIMQVKLLMNLLMNESLLSRYQIGVEI